MTTVAIRCPRCAASARPCAGFCSNCGSPLERPDPTGVSAARPWAWWRARAGWRRHRGRLLLAAIVVAVLAATAVIYIGQAHSSPDQPVREWFTALAARDTGTAAHLRPGIEVLRGDLLRSDAYTPPSDAQVLKTSYAPSTDQQKRPNHTTAYVSVRYHIGNAVFEQSIQVNRGTGGAVRPWILGEGATGILSVGAGPLQRVRLGAVDIPAKSNANGTDFAATTMVPPGRYTITADPDDPVFASAPTDVAVPGRMRDQPSTTAALHPTFKPQAVDAIQEQVRQRVEDCAQRQSLSLVDCPFDRSGGSYTGTVTTVHWTIRRYPVIGLRIVDRPYGGGPVATLTTTTPGIARVAYAAYTTGGKTVIEEQQFTVGGDLRIEEGGLVWTGGKSGRLI